MSEKVMARNLSQQEPGRGKRHATAACTPNIGRGPARHHESADEYSGTLPCAGGPGDFATGQRLERMVERVHALGPRVLAELLGDIARRTDQSSFIMDRLQAYAVLDPEIVRFVGGDRFLPSVLCAVRLNDEAPV